MNDPNQSHLLRFSSTPCFFLPFVTPHRRADAPRACSRPSQMGGRHFKAVVTSAGTGHYKGGDLAKN